MVILDNKNVFWEALVIAIFLFGIGIVVGFLIEDGRTNQINNMYQDSELNLIEITLQSDIISTSSSDCDSLVKNNINFGDRIYEYAKLLEKYQSSAKLTDTLLKEHKKYDLLRIRFWLNSIKIKEKCGNSFHTVVYFYDYNIEDITITAKQGVFSEYLKELKDREGNKIMLIPIAKNMDIDSLNLLIDKYNISDTFVLVDEKLAISDVNNLRLIDRTID
jgi:hypothetical protein